MISYHIPLPYNQNQGPEELQILIEGRNGDEKSKIFSEEGAAFQSPNLQIPELACWSMAPTIQWGGKVATGSVRHPALSIYCHLIRMLWRPCLRCIRCQSSFIFSPGGQLTQQHTAGDSSLQILQNESGEHLSCCSLGSSQSHLFVSVFPNR